MRDTYLVLKQYPVQHLQPGSNAGLDKCNYDWHWNNVIAVAPIVTLRSQLVHNAFKLGRCGCSLMLADTLQPQ